MRPIGWSRVRREQAQRDDASASWQELRAAGVIDPAAPDPFARIDWGRSSDPRPLIIRGETEAVVAGCVRWPFGATHDATPVPVEGEQP